MRHKGYDIRVEQDEDSLEEGFFWFVDDDGSTLFTSYAEPGNRNRLAYDTEAEAVEKAKKVIDGATKFFL